MSDQDNFSLQYQYNIKQISDENKEKYEWLTVRRIKNLIWELKG